MTNPRRMGVPPDFMSLTHVWTLQSSSAERPEAMKILSEAADGSLLQSHSLSAGVHRIRTRKKQSLPGSW